MFGHPLHPALVHFPIALLLSATAADVAWLAGLTGDTQFGAVLMAAGLAMGLLAMGAGLVDFVKLDEALVPHALRHIAAVGLAWIGYGIALVTIAHGWVPMRPEIAGQANPAGLYFATGALALVLLQLAIGLVMVVSTSVSIAELCVSRTTPLPSTLTR